MAITKAGQYVSCDGKDCTSKVSLPIALRPLLSGNKTVDQLKGWLFVTVGGQRRHYCPKCVPTYFVDLGKAEE